MKTTELTVLTAALCFSGFLPQTLGQIIYVPQSAPYTNDANTVLLEHFDGTTTGTANGPVSYTNGVFGQAAQVNTNSYVLWSLGGLNKGTVEFWANVDMIPATNAGFGFIYAGLEPNNWPTFTTGMTDTAQVGSLYDDVNGNWQGMAQWTNSQSIAINSWHHYATTWGSHGFHFYVDGTLIYSNAVTTAQDAGTAYWSVSANVALGNMGAGFAGAVDELRISDVQRVFAPLPQATFVKAFTVDFTNLLVGSNYQAQASPDMLQWTNWGTAFTATNSTYTNTNYQRIADWNQIFIRLVQQ
jgi:hypothetical protein